MAKWQRSFFQPVLPLGEDGRRVTGSKEHIALSRMAAGCLLYTSISASISGFIKMCPNFPEGRNSY